jgi:hypothetical protein
LHASHGSGDERIAQGSGSGRTVELNDNGNGNSFLPDHLLALE